MPRTLILTAQYDPLRDEGEAFGKRLEEAGNEVTVCRIRMRCMDFLRWALNTYTYKKVLR